MTRLEMILRDLTDKAIAGNSTAVVRVVRLMREFDNLEPQSVVEAQGRVRRAATEEWYRDFKEQRARSGEAFSKKKGGANKPEGTSEPGVKKSENETQQDRERKSTDDEAAKPKASEGSTAGTTNAQKRGGEADKTDGKAGAEEPMTAKPAAESVSGSSDNVVEAPAIAPAGSSVNGNDLETPPTSQHAAKGKTERHNDHQFRINP